MKLPQTPPNAEKLLKGISSKEKFLKIVEVAKLTDGQGRYLHWDELRRRKPPQDLTPEEWWLGLQVARKGAAQVLPFKDTGGRNFFFTEPLELKSLLRFADMNAAGFLGSPGDGGMTAEDGKRYMRRSLAEEPFMSSLIEGAVTTREVAKRMIFDRQVPRTRDEKMVLNNYRGMEFVKENRNEILTPEMILELHGIMTEGTLDDPTGAGRLRTNHDRIAVVDDSSGDILHTPPAAADLPDRLKSLCDFANKIDDDPTCYHPFLRAVALHFMLAYDHPFVDGNGRTARALFYWLMLRSGYWLMEYTSISSIIADSPTSYYKAFLFSETDHGDITYFFLHQARVTCDALKQMHRYADQKRREFDDFQSIVSEQRTGSPLNQRQVSLIQDMSLGREKFALISEYEKRYSVSYLTARNDLEDMVFRGLLRKSKKGRTSFYWPTGKISKSLPGSRR